MQFRRIKMHLLQKCRTMIEKSPHTPLNCTNTANNSAVTSNLCFLTNIAFCAASFVWILYSGIPEHALEEENASIWKGKRAGRILSGLGMSAFCNFSFLEMTNHREASRCRNRHRERRCFSPCFYQIFVTLNSISRGHISYFSSGGFLFSLLC